MLYINGLTVGDFPAFKDEQELKMWFMKNRFGTLKGDIYSFCIETEETCAGFPDVMVTDKRTSETTFYEFKHSHDSNSVKFRPAQPAFYRKHDKMNIYIIAYNSRSGIVHMFTPEEMFDESSPYFMSENGTVNLLLAEKCSSFEE